MMKTHNAIIYHCLSCGKIEHRDQGQEAPSCCGKLMVKAAAETVVDNEGEESKGANPQPGMPSSTAPTNLPKPR
jgi:DNA-directed RNA polymerase subunit RPC12/RpoP